LNELQGEEIFSHTRSFDQKLCGFLYLKANKERAGNTIHSSNIFLIKENCAILDRSIRITRVLIHSIPVGEVKDMKSGILGHLTHHFLKNNFELSF
jgi:hypothetical protein